MRAPRRRPHFSTGVSTESARQAAEQPLLKPLGRAGECSITWRPAASRHLTRAVRPRLSLVDNDCRAAKHRAPPFLLLRPKRARLEQFAPPLPRIPLRALGARRERRSLRRPPSAARGRPCALSPPPCAPLLRTVGHAGAGRRGVRIGHSAAPPARRLPPSKHRGSPMIGLSSSSAGALFLAKGGGAPAPLVRSYRACFRHWSALRLEPPVDRGHSNLTYGPSAGLSRLWSRSVLPLLKPFEELASAIPKMRADTKGGRSAVVRDTESALLASASPTANAPRRQSRPRC
jgi:hypothetical protein